MHGGWRRTATAPRTCVRPRWWDALRRPGVAIPTLVVAVAALAVFWTYGKRAWDQRWTRTVALPEIARLAERDDYLTAMDLALQAEPLLAGDPDLAALWPRMTRTIAIESEPAGATVSYAPYGVESGWRALGTTPLKDVRVPIGVLRMKAEKPGFDPAEDVSFFEVRSRSRSGRLVRHLKAWCVSRPCAATCSEIRPADPVRRLGRWARFHRVRTTGR